MVHLTSRRLIPRPLSMASTRLRTSKATEKRVRNIAMAWSLDAKEISTYMCQMAKVPYVSEFDQSPSFWKGKVLLFRCNIILCRYQQMTTSCLHPGLCSANRTAFLDPASRNISALIIQHLKSLELYYLFRVSIKPSLLSKSQRYTRRVLGYLYRSASFQ